MIMKISINDIFSLKLLLAYQISFAALCIANSFIQLNIMECDRFSQCTNTNNLPTTSIDTLKIAIDMY